MSQSQLYEWIRASEKMPDVKGTFITRYPTLNYNNFIVKERTYNPILGADFWLDKDPEIEWLSPVSTDWGKLESELIKDAGTESLHKVDGFKVFHWIKQHLVASDNNNSNVPCVAQVDSSNSIEQIVTAFNRDFTQIMMGADHSTSRQEKYAFYKAGFLQAPLTSPAQKDIEVYVPVDVDGELPEYYNPVPCWIDRNRWISAWRTNDGENDIWTITDTSQITITKPTHWLKKVTLSSLLTDNEK